jgi:cephalosporin hydroxylase
VGSYIIVQDTAIGHRVPKPRGPPNPPGAWDAVQEFLAETDAFEIDTTRERFGASNNPQGFLKRVK